MFNKLKSLFSSTIYIQLREERITITNIDTQSVYDQRPYIAIDVSNPKQKVIRAVGADAYNLRLDKSLEVTNPFSHPRLLIADFNRAEKVLMQGLREVNPAKFIAPRPMVIIHPMDKLEGGLTDIECKVYRELALGAGAIEVHLHVGEALEPSTFSMEQVSTPLFN